MTTEQRQPYYDAIRNRAGNFESNSLLVAFLYDLMKDHVTPGAMEKIIMENQHLLEQSKKDGFDKVQYCNGWLARYAEDLANRLTLS